MRYKIQCDLCGATTWLNGSYEEDTNATILDDNEVSNWEPANQCEHQDFTIIDQEVRDDE